MTFSRLAVNEVGRIQAAAEAMHTALMCAALEELHGDVEHFHSDESSYIDEDGVRRTIVVTGSVLGQFSRVKLVIHNGSVIYSYLYTPAKSTQGKGTLSAQPHEPVAGSTAIKYIPAREILMATAAAVAKSNALYNA